MTDAGSMGDGNTQALSLDVQQFGTGAIIRVCGELDAYSAPRLEELGSGLIADSVGELVVELSETSFLDSSGLRAILTLHQRVGNDGGVFAIGNPSESVMRLLEITGLADHFTIRLGGATVTVSE